MELPAACPQPYDYKVCVRRGPGYRATAQQNVWFIEGEILLEARLPADQP